MAISLVTATTPTATNFATGYTITISSNAQADDILLIGWANRGATNTPPTVTDDDGSTATWNTLTSTGGAAGFAGAHWKRAVAATPGSLLTLDGFTDSCAGAFGVMRGVITTATPFENASEESNAAGFETHSGGATDVPSNDSSMVVFLVCNVLADVAVSAISGAGNPSTYALEAEHLNSGGNDASVAFAVALQSTATAEAFGNITWAQTNAANVSILFNLIPATATATATGGAGASGHRTRMLLMGVGH